jgi:hypothetical protein
MAAGGEERAAKAAVVTVFQGSVLLPRLKIASFTNTTWRRGMSSVTYVIMYHHDGTHDNNIVMNCSGINSHVLMLMIIAALYIIVQNRCDIRTCWELIHRKARASRAASMRQ